MTSFETPLCVDSADVGYRAGFYGPYCQERVGNMCDAVTCRNNGTCSGNATHFRCACAAGFRGSHCEVNVNECASNPCVNGLCVDRDNGYACYCKPGKSFTPPAGGEGGGGASFYEDVVAVECCFTSTKTVGLLGTGAQDGHLDFHTAPEFCYEDVPLVEFVYLVFTRMSSESYRSRLRSLWSCLCDVFQVLMNSFGLLILRVVLMFVDSVPSTLPSSSCFSKQV